MKVCTPLLLPSLLCYLPTIARTPAHCSLASCQTWFLTPVSSLPLFLLCCHAASPLPHLSFWVSHQSHCFCLCMRVCVCAHARARLILQGCRFHRFYIAASCVPSCFSTSICSWYVKTLLWYQTSTEAVNLTPTLLQDHRCVHAGIVTAAPVFAAVRARIYQPAYWPTLYTDTRQYSDVQKERWHNVAHLHFTSKCGAGERTRGGN